MIAQLRLDSQGATKFIKRKCTGSLGADSNVTVETQSAQLTSLSRYKHACRENVALREGFYNYSRNRAATHCNMHGGTKFEIRNSE